MNTKAKRIPHIDFEAGQAKRRRIMSLCYQLPIDRGFTKFDTELRRRVVDMDRLNEFLQGKHSIFKKKLNYHTSPELSKVIIQFENMLKGYMK